MYDAPFYKGSQKLRNSVAIVTAAIQGSAAPRPYCSHAGADIAIVHLAEPKDAEITRKAVEAEGQDCIVLQGDVIDRGFCKLAVAQTVKQLGGLTVLVNNAAFQLHLSRFEDLTEAQFDRTMKTNLLWLFPHAKAAVPYLKAGSRS